MANRFDWQVVIDLAMNGGPQTKRELDVLTRAQQQLDSQSKKTTESIKGQGEATKNAGRNFAALEKQANSLRYANYDLAQTFLGLSAGITAAGTATVVAFAQQERAFTNVERTAEGSLGTIRDTLTDLSTTIPLAFTDLAEIATLGNQLGVASGDLEKFTETVASFSTATGITAEAAAQAFGRIGNILGVSASDYDRLASAIVYTGRTSAATEKEIISLTERLGASATRAGFAEEQVIGLAGALGSVAVAPERAQGVFETYFNTLNESLAEGGRRAELFAQVVGVSVDELNQMVRGGQGLEVFSRFASTLGDSSVDTVELTNALSELGLSGLRANEVIGRISQRMPLFQKSMENSTKAYAENTELQSQMALILDDLTSKWTTTANAVVNFAAALGSTLAPVLGPVLDGIKQVVIALTEFIQTPVGSALAQVVAVLGAAAAAFAAYRGLVALATASTFALVTAQRGLAAAGVTSAMGGLASALGLVAGSSGTAAAGITVLRGALVRLLGATGVGAVLVLLGGAVVDLRGTLQGLIGFMQGSYNTVGKYFNGFRTAIGFLAGLTNVFLDVTGLFAQSTTVFAASSKSIQSSFDGIAKRALLTFRLVEISIQNIVSRLGVFGKIAGAVFKPLTDAVGRFQKGFEAGSDFIDSTVNQSFNALNDLAGLLPSTLDEASGSTDDFSNALTGASGSAGGLGDAVEETSAKVRTLVDYAGDLSSVFDRAFSIRYDSQSTLDAINSQFQEMRDAAKETSRNIQQLQADLGLLNADLNTQQYFLSIATKYGDEKRAQALRAQIAKTQADIADKTADLTAEQQKNNRTLTGNTQAARTNRSTVLGLVQEYQGHVAALAASGLSTEELQRRTAQLEQDFIAQATQLGFNRAELGLYTAAFRDVRVAIDNVPRDITVNFNADPALQALNEFAARVGEVAGSAATNAGDVFATNFGDRVESVLNDRVKSQISSALDNALRSLTLVSGSDPAAGLWGVAGRPRGFADGGYTGSGGKYEPAGIVHRGEYVIPKQYVNQATGLPNADALGRLQRGAPGRRGYAGGGYVSGGGMSGHIASFGPMAAMQLAQALSTQFVFDSGAAAGAVNRQNARSSALSAG